MDPVTLIVAAVVAGASAGVTDAVKEEVKKAYGALRKKLLELFGDATTELAVTALEDNPGSSTAKAALTDRLGRESIGAQDELVGLAERVTAATGLQVEQIQRLATGASVLNSGQFIEGVESETAKQLIDAGEDSRVENSTQSIKFGRPQH